MADSVAKKLRDVATMTAIALAIVLTLWFLGGSMAQRGYRLLYASETVRICGTAAVKYYQLHGALPRGIADLQTAGLLKCEADALSCEVPGLTNGLNTEFLDNIQFIHDDPERPVRLVGVKGAAIDKAENYVSRLYRAVRSGGDLGEFSDLREYLLPSGNNPSTSPSNTPASSWPTEPP